MSESIPPENRLAKARSPYLLQHKHNPVDWYEWGEEAFEEARRRDVPVFLSIGYATCHWCHVMERESFEDEEVAELLNKHFVSIKVDREERPDIDGVYMAVCQMISQSCGWPLSVFMTPDKDPFFVATYIPKNSAHGRPGMMEMLPGIAQAWDAERDKFDHNVTRIREMLAKHADAAPGDGLDKEVIEDGYAGLKRAYDSEHGGFGQRPKFPSPHNLLFLLQHWHRENEEDARNMAEKSLQCMRAGGIWDHIGFGFHRYSTDAHWFLPHFEKMLYDQATHLLAYAEAYQATGDAQYKQTCDEIITYLNRDMLDPTGAYHAAEDADSDGEEGLFYLWKHSEVQQLLGDDANIFCAAYGIVEGGTHHDEATGEKTGMNIPFLPRRLEELAEDLHMPAHELKQKLQQGRRRLFKEREKRNRPLRDDKILTDWNGLLVAALARAGWIAGEDAWIDDAVRTAEFLLDTLRRPDGRLWHRYRGGEAGIKAFVDDYVFLAWGLMECYTATREVRWLRETIELLEILDNDFLDAEQGGYFFTAADAEKLPTRKKEVHDGAVPSANSAAMMLFNRLARITGDQTFADKARRTGAAFAGQVKHIPGAHTMMLAATGSHLARGMEIVIVGEPDDPQTRRMLALVREKYLPDAVLMLKTRANAEELAAVAPFTAEQKKLDGSTTAYVCHNFVCHAPTTDPDALKKMLTAEEETGR